MKIYLRPITPEDGLKIVKWRNSDKVLSHCFDKRKITPESNEKFYKANVETGKYKQFIVERMDEDFGVSSYPIGTVYLKDFDEGNHRCELCVFTSDDQEWNNESQSIAIRMLLKTAFENYQMHKVYTYVFASNRDEAALLKNAGFTDEALLKEEACDLKGTYVDVIRLSILAGDYLKEENKDL